MITKTFALLCTIALCNVALAQDPGPNPPPGMPGMPPGGLPGGPGMPGMHPGMGGMGGMPGMPGIPPEMDEEITVPFLGVEASPVGPDMRSQLKLPGESGLIVNFVAPDSPAQAAGVQRYDLLTSVDGQILFNPPQLQSLIRSHKAGDEIKLTLIRQSQTQTLSAKLTEHTVTNSMMPPGMPMMPPGMSGGMGPMMGMGPRGMPSLQRLALEDGDTRIEVKAINGEVTLTATTKSGEQLYSGPIDTPEQRAKLPDKVRTMLDDLAVDNLIQRMKGASLHPRFRRGGPPATLNAQ